MMLRSNTINRLGSNMRSNGLEEDPIAMGLASRANHQANEQDYYGAIRLYSEAIERDSEDFRFYLNRCCCYTRLELYQLALEDAQQAIKLRPQVAKCYLRKGQALLGLGKYTDAEKAFKESLLRDSNCLETRNELVKVRYKAFLHLGLDEANAVSSARKYESIEEGTESILNDRLHRNLDLGLEMAYGESSNLELKDWSSPYVGLSMVYPCMDPIQESPHLTNGHSEYNNSPFNGIKTNDFRCFGIGFNNSGNNHKDLERPNGLSLNSFNTFNQLPDSKLIEAIVPNISCGETESANNSDLSQLDEIDPPESNDESSRNSSSIGTGPTSYSDIVKRAKSTKSDCTKPPVNNCVSPAEEEDHSGSNNVEDKSGPSENVLKGGRPTNLWGYNGLRVAGVSNSCPKATLLSLFTKYGRVKLIERINNKTVENNIWVYYDNPNSPVEAVAKLQGMPIEGISVNNSPLRLYFAPTDDQKDLKFSRPKQPPDNKGECYYWRTTNCFSRDQCPLLHIQANKNIDAQIWMKMNKEPGQGK